MRLLGLVWVLIGVWIALESWTLWGSGQEEVQVGDKLAYRYQVKSWTSEQEEPNWQRENDIEVEVLAVYEPDAPCRWKVRDPEGGERFWGCRAPSCSQGFAAVDVGDGFGEGVAPAGVGQGCRGEFELSLIHI